MSHVDLKGPVLRGPAEVMDLILKQAEHDTRMAIHEVEGRVKMLAEGHRRTGHLMRSYTPGGPDNVMRVERGTTRLTFYFGSRLAYAHYLEKGTGLYGPRHQLIRPLKPGGVLAWPAAGSATLGGRLKAGGTMVFAAYSRGIKPLHLLERAAEETKPKREEIFRAGARKIAAQLGQGK